MRKHIVRRRQIFRRRHIFQAEVYFQAEAYFQVQAFFFRRRQIFRNRHIFGRRQIFRRRHIFKRGKIFRLRHLGGGGSSGGVGGGRSYFNIKREERFPTKNSLTKFFLKMHRFRIIHQKLNSKGFFRPLVVTHLLKIHFLQKISQQYFSLKCIDFDLFTKK